MAKTGKRKRMQASIKKIGQLVRAGTPFNTSRVSGQTLQASSAPSAKAEIRKRLNVSGQFESPLPRPKTTKVMGEATRAAKEVASTFTVLGKSPKFDNAPVGKSKKGSGFR